MIKLFRRYCVDKRYIIFPYFGTILIFLVLFWLFQIDFKYIWYPSLLSLLVWLCATAFSFYRYRKAHLLRMEALESVDVTLDHIPRPDTLVEQEYTELIQKVFDAAGARITENDAKTSELYEYIMLWSHQLKTPITAMGLLLQEPERDNIAASLEQLFEMERYVDTLLQYLKLDSMSNDLVLEHYSLENMVKQSIKYYSKIFISKHLTIETRGLEKSVLTDEKWFVFCLKQIISNALKYTRSGGISIYTTGEKGITLVIEDTGIGISEEDIPRVFEKGYTGYNGRMDKKATGIGLYLTKRILDKLDHKVWIESEIDKGTKVNIQLTSKV